jgi:hypothetical protein
MMSALFHAGSPGAFPSYRIAAAVLLRRVGRLIDSWVAGVIARRERELANSMRHGPRDTISEVQRLRPDGCPR